MCDYAMTLWETADHRQGEMSFKRNGLNNDLSGREDRLISREARELWFALGMPSERKRVEVEVDMFLETLRTERAAVTESPADAIRPEDVFELIEDYPENVGPGEEREGEELLASDLAVLDEGDRSGSDESAEEDAAEEPAPSAEVAKGMAPDPEVKEPEVGLVSDLSRLEVMIAVAQGMDDPAILRALRLQRERLLRCVRRSDAGVAAAANAYREDARQKIREMQEAARLEDEALQRLTQAKQEARLFKAKSAKRRLVSEGPADVAPPAAGPAATVAFGDGVPSLAIADGAPSLVDASPSAVAVLAFPGGVPALGHGAPVVSAALAPGGGAPGSGDGVPPASAPKAVVAGGGDGVPPASAPTAVVVDGGDGVPPASAPKAVAVGGDVAPALPPHVFSVEVDTESRLRVMLSRLAHEWISPDKEQTLRWLARDIRSQAVLAKKHAKENVVGALCSVLRRCSGCPSDSSASAS